MKEKHGQKKSVPKEFSPQQKADVLRQYELRLITQAAACQILRVSPATFFRYLKKLGEGGVEALKHGNTGKRPHNRMEESRRS